MIKEYTVTTIQTSRHPEGMPQEWTQSYRWKATSKGVIEEKRLGAVEFEYNGSSKRLVKSPVTTWLCPRLIHRTESFTEAVEHIKHHCQDLVLRGNEGKYLNMT